MWHLILLASLIIANLVHGGSIPPTKEQLADPQFKYIPRVLRPASAKTAQGTRKRRAPDAVGSSWNRADYEERYTLEHVKKRYPNCPSIGQIWNQGPCGTCYVVAAMGVYTDRKCIADGGTSNKFYSARQGAGCTHPTRSPNDICDMGGCPLDVLNTIVKEGIATGGRFVTDDVDDCLNYGVENKNPGLSEKTPANYPKMIIPLGGCARKCRKVGANIARETASGTNTWVEHRDLSTPQSKVDMVKFIKDEVFAEGPVAASIFFFKDFMTWNFKEKGPYYRPGDSTETTTDTHSVRIIGWDKWKNPLNPFEEIPYWIAASSGGTGFHEGGFAYVKMGVNTVDIEQNIYGIRIYNDHALFFGQPPTCNPADFNDNALFDLAVPVDAMDPTAPYHVFQGQCVQLMKKTANGLAKIGNPHPIQHVFQNAPTGRIVKYKLSPEAGRKIQYYFGNGLEGLTAADTKIGLSGTALIALYDEKNDASLCRRVTDTRFICEHSNVQLGPGYKDYPVAQHYTDDRALNLWWINPKSPTKLTHDHYSADKQLHKTEINLGDIAVMKDFGKISSIIYLDFGSIAIFGQDRAAKNAINVLLTYTRNPQDRSDDTPFNVAMAPLVITEA